MQQKSLFYSLMSAKNHMEQIVLTFWAIIVGSSHVPVQSDPYNTTLRMFELIAV